MNGRTRTIAMSLSGLIALGGAAACGSSSSGSSPTANSTANSSTQPAKPLAGPLTLDKGVHTQVILDGGFLSALQSLKVTPGVIGSAKLNAKTGTLTFPITSGNATYYKPGTRSPYVVAVIHHNGSGITLTAGGITVGLKNFVVDATNSKLTGDVTANGKSVAKGADLFFLNGRTLQPLTTPTPSTAVLYGTKVYLSQTAADLLTQTYKLKPGTLSTSTLIGTAKITLGI